MNIAACVTPAFAQQASIKTCAFSIATHVAGDYFRRRERRLHVIEGLSAEEIGEVCRCSLATAKVRIHRARVRLKEALRHECRFYRDGDDVFRCDRKP